MLPWVESVGWGTSTSALPEGAIPGGSMRGRKWHRVEWGENAGWCTAEQSLLQEDTAGHFAMWDVSEQTLQKHHALKKPIMEEWGAFVFLLLLSLFPHWSRFSPWKLISPCFWVVLPGSFRSHWGSQVPHPAACRSSKSGSHEACWDLRWHNWVVSQSLFCQRLGLGKTPVSVPKPWEPLLASFLSRDLRLLFLVWTGAVVSCSGWTSGLLWYTGGINSHI